MFPLFPPRLQPFQTLWLGTPSLAKGCGNGQRFYLWLKGAWDFGKGKTHVVEAGLGLLFVVWNLLLAEHSSVAAGFSQFCQLGNLLNWDGFGEEEQEG